MVSERQKAMERGLDSPICEPWQPSQSVKRILGAVCFGTFRVVWKDENDVFFSPKIEMN